MRIIMSHSYAAFGLSYSDFIALYSGNASLFTYNLIVNAMSKRNVIPSVMEMAFYDLYWSDNV